MDLFKKKYTVRGEKGKEIYTELSGTKRWRGVLVMKQARRESRKGIRYKKTMTTAQ